MDEERSIEELQAEQAETDDESLRLKEERRVRMAEIEPAEAAVKAASTALEEAKEAYPQAERAWRRSEGKSSNLGEQIRRVQARIEEAVSAAST